MDLSCDHCGKLFHKKKSQIEKTINHFCSKNCSNLWKVGKKRESKCVLVNCDYCKMEFPINPFVIKELNEKKRKSLCCSRKCSSKWKAEHLLRGELNPNYNRKKKICNNCNSEYIIDACINYSKFCSRKCKDSYKTKIALVELECLKCKIKFHRKKSRLHSRNFCSKKCHSIWNHENDEYTKNGVKAMKKIYKETKPEKITKKFLVENNIKFFEQMPLFHRFVIDFCIPDKNMIIEVFGDYWHCNPLFYGYDENKKEPTSRQLSQIEKDSYKINFLKSKGYDVRIVWENDLYKNAEETLMFLLD